MGEHEGHRARLRQRFLEHGLDALQDHEVLELLLSYAIPRMDTKPLAWALLRQFGSLSAVLEASPAVLETVKGIGPHAASLLSLMLPLGRRYLTQQRTDKTPLTSPVMWGEYLLPYFYGAVEETVYLLFLDAQSRPISCRLVQEGSANSAALSIRQVVELSMQAHASQVILSHNHPGGVALPSHADYETTELLAAALLPLDIVLADHIVVSGEDFVSFRENGYLHP